MKIHLVLALFLVAGAVLVVPSASAACEPLTDPEYCTGTIPTIGVPEIECWWNQNELTPQCKVTR